MRYNRLAVNFSDVALTEGVVTDIVQMGRFAAARGLVPATSGNFSCRIDADHIAITRSGIDKGSLGGADLARICLSEALPPGVSAETPLHVSRYRADPSIGAIMHVHSISATVLSRADAAHGKIELRGFEMQKALRGITTHEGVLVLPIFANSQDTASLAQQVEERLGRSAGPAYLLAGHGMYVWGNDATEAQRHLEAIDFLLTCVLEERRICR